MKNMKISMRLFLSFAIVLILLVVVVATENTMISSIRLSEDRQQNAASINESVQLMRSWTLDYYATVSDEAATSVEDNYNTTMMLIEEGKGLHRDDEAKNIMETMKVDLELYHETFNHFIQLVEQNDQYFFDMIASADNVLSKMNQLIVSQKNDVITIQSKSIHKKDTINGHDLATQMFDKYEQSTISNAAVESIQRTMNSEMMYFYRSDKSFDDEVYTQLDELKEQCDWLYENFDKETDKSSIQNIRGYIDDYIEKYEAYKELLDMQEIEKAELRALASKITDSARDMVAVQELKMSNSMTNAVLSSIIVGVVSVIIGVLFAFVLSRSLSKQLSGNMIRLNSSAQLVSTASSQLSGTSQQLSQGSAEQAASIEETSATMDETSSMVKQNADNTKQANQLSNDASKSAVEGSSMMKDMNVCMDEIKESSGEIAKIIKVIDDIAFQTNMLALNAAVEAARAGDAGLGFAVVAQEVRNLAQKSAQAAKDTAVIIDRNIELSQQGVIISDDVGEALEEIMSKTNKVNRIIGEISQASDEQAKGTAQVSVAIGEMEKVVQSNAATAEESAASAEELKKQAVNLEEVVSELNKLVKGSNVKSMTAKTKEHNSKIPEKQIFKRLRKRVSDFTKKNHYAKTDFDRH